jgi:hypothetical protein
MLMDIVRIKPGYSEVIEGVEFRLNRGHINVFVQGQYADTIEVGDAVTTSQHLQEQAGWWLYEWNMI